MTLGPVRFILLSSPPTINASSSVHISESRRSSQSSQRVQSRSCHGEQIRFPMSISQSPNLQIWGPNGWDWGEEVRFC